MKIAIIGASGLLGGHLIEQGLKQDHRILAVARRFSKRSAAAFYQDKIELLELDAAKDLKSSHLQGIDIVINAAAKVSAEQEVSFVDENLQILKNVYEAAVSAGVKSFVHVSSISTMASGSTDKTVSESDFGQFRETPYAESKFRCDEWLKAQKKLHLLIVYPCFMLGKWDAKPSSGAILLAIQLRKINGFFPGVKNFVHAGDVATGIYQAIEKNVQGDFILGGENVSFETFLTKCIHTLGLNRTLQKLSLEELDEVGSLKEFFLANPVDDSRARKEWGYESKASVDDMIIDAISYFRDHRLLPRAKGSV